MPTPSRRAVRRRRAAVGAAAAVAAAAGIAVGAGDDDRARPRPGADGAGRSAATPTPAPRRSAEPIERAAGRLVIQRFAGPELPAYVSRALREGRAAGVILFDDNVVDPPQLRRLTAAVRRAGGPGALVLADQEGGDIRIVPWAGPEQGAASQLAAGTVRAQSRAAGRTLRDAGVDVALAPVADVPTAPGSALAGRAFAREPEAAAAAVGDAVAGFRAGGVAPTAKHFPGLGGATTNTDDGPADVPGTPDLAPFEAAIEAGVPLVMLSHARYPALDPDAVASQSRAVATTLLRERLGFRGVAVTDSLEADAAMRTGTLEAVAQRSVAAGSDLLLTTGRGSALRVYRRILTAARRSPGFARRVREAAGRVDRLRREAARRRRAG